MLPHLINTLTIQFHPILPSRGSDQIHPVELYLTPPISHHDQRQLQYLPEHIDTDHTGGVNTPNKGHHQNMASSTPIIAPVSSTSPQPDDHRFASPQPHTQTHEENTYIPYYIERERTDTPLTITDISFSSITPLPYHSITIPNHSLCNTKKPS